MANSVGVYYSGQDFSVDRPAFFVDRKTARQWLRVNAAWSVNHGRDIALAPEATRGGDGDGDKEPIRELEMQPSQVMGEPVMRANAELEKWAVRVTRSWHGKFARLEHARSLKRYRELAHDTPTTPGGVLTQPFDQRAE